MISNKSFNLINKACNSPSKNNDIEVKYYPHSKNVYIIEKSTDYDIYLNEYITNLNLLKATAREIGYKYETIDSCYKSYSWEKKQAYNYCLDTMERLERLLDLELIGQIVRGNSFVFTYKALLKDRFNRYWVLVITPSNNKIGILEG